MSFWKVHFSNHFSLFDCPKQPTKSHQLGFLFCQTKGTRF